MWVRDNKVWYEAELIDRIKELCNRRPYQTIDKIQDLIKEYEGKER